MIIDNVFNSFAPASITEYTIPDYVVSITNRTFLGCLDLTSITIPENVTSIGDATFFGCTSLNSVYCKTTTPPNGDFMFFDNDWNLKIYVPTESVEVYKIAEGWKDYAHCIVGYDFENGIVAE